jgi:hypothetical protein
MSRAILVALCLSVAAPALSEESVRDEAERWIEMKMRAAIERPQRFEVRPVDEAPPAWLGDAPADLVDAWRSYRTLEAALQKRLPAAPATPRVGINQFNLGDTDSPVRRFLRGERVDLVREASRLYWSNNFCGTGIGSFLLDRDRMVLMGLLAKGDHPAAAAAALFHDASYWHRADGDLVPHYLQALGLDWERLYLGALIASYDPGPGIETRDFRRRLVEHGSVRAARGLLALSRLRPFDTPTELAMLGEFVESGPVRLSPTASQSDGVVVEIVVAGPYGDFHHRKNPLYLEPPEQSEILERLAACVNAQTSHADLERVVHRLHGLRREEGRAALRRALELPNGPARESAAVGLRAMGEAVEKVEPLLPVPSVTDADVVTQPGRACPTAAP